MSMKTGLIGFALLGAVVVGYVMLTSSDTGDTGTGKKMAATHVSAKSAVKAEESGGALERAGRAADELLKQAVVAPAEMGEVGETAIEATEEVTEAVSETAKEVGETAKELGAVAAKVAAKALEKAKEHTDKAIVKAEEIADKGKEKAIEAAEELSKDLSGDK